MNIDLAKQQLTELAKLIETRVVELIEEERNRASDISPILLDVLNRVLDLSKGGKALRGAFVITAASLKGKKTTEESITLAAIIEIIHLTLLIFDDVIDDGSFRRGIPTVHAVYQDAFPNISNSKLFGQGIAISTGLAVEHSIYGKIASLELPPEIKISLLQYIHRSVADTGYGELLDVYSVVYEKPTDDYVMKVLDYKTARYTYELPLHVGMLLAGGSETDFAAIKNYSYHAGIAFQIIDDILGVFGDENTGKSIMSDIREGKRTLLVTHAYEIATPDQLVILNKELGNNDLTIDGINRVKEVMEQTGAKEYARETAEHMMEKSETYLTAMSGVWDSKSIDFLVALNQYVLTRNK